MIFEKLAKLVAEHFVVDVEDITMDTHFVDDLNANSIDVVDLMLEVEETFGLPEIQAEDLENIRTIGEVVDYISDRM